MDASIDGLSCGHDIIDRSNRHFIHVDLERGSMFSFFLCYGRCSKAAVVDDGELGGLGDEHGTR